MPKQANRVSETSATTGNGSITLAGVFGKHRTFATAFGTGGSTEVDYSIEHETANEWEVGIGTYLGPSNTLQRDKVLSSSDGGSKVAFSAGSKVVFVTAPAEGPRVVRAPRSTDTPLEIRAASGQTAPLVQIYNGAGAASLQIDSGGNLRLAADINEKLRIPQNETGAFVGVRSDLLGSPGVPGIRLRWSGTGGTTGVLQLSEGDVSRLQIQPSTGEIRAIIGAGAGGGAGSGVGPTFLDGIKIKNNDAEIDGVAVGHIAFDCAGSTGNTSWDLGPSKNGGTGIHSVRIGRRSGGNTTVQLIVLEPGTPNARVTLESTGRVTALVGAIGDYYVGGLNDGSANSAYISAKTGFGFNVRSGFAPTADAHVLFRGNDSTVLARIDADGTATVDGNTLITREKGDARYAAVSARRFKEQITDAEGLAAIFPLLRPRRYIHGGELPDSDERRGCAGLGFVIEDMVGPLPEACRYLDDGDGPRLHSRDDGAILAVVHAKLTEVDARLAAIETAPKARRR